MVRLLSTLLTWILLVFISLPAYAGTKKALLIGISQYAELNCLSYADNDAREMADILTDFAGYSPSDIYLILNQDATKDNIKRAFNKLIQATERENTDHVLIMFCGHGRPSNVPSSKTNIFLAPTDASVSRHSFYYTKSGFTENDTFINKPWLARKIASIKANKLILILDSCYSGIKDFGELFALNLGYKFDFTQKVISERGSRGIVVVRKSERSDVAPRDVALLAASSEERPSVEYEPLKHGAMSYCILKHIENTRLTSYENEKTKIFIGELFTDLRKMFIDIKIDGIRLADIHKPLLFPIPSYERISRMEFLSIKGTKKKVIARKGKIRINTDVDGAEVYVDNRPSGKATDCELELIEGQYRITLRVPKWNYSHSFTAHIRHDQSIVEDISLRGDLIVESYWEEKEGLREVKGLKVFIDGDYQGESRLFLKTLIAGTHYLSVKYGEEYKERKIEIRPDSPLRVRYLLIRQTPKREQLDELIKIPG
jgi:hypothetical protein